MRHNEATERLSVEIRGVQYITPVLWATDQPSSDIVIGNNFQVLYSLCTQIINQKIFTIDGQLVPIDKLNKAYTPQKIEFTHSQYGEKVILT